MREKTGWSLAALALCAVTMTPQAAFAQEDENPSTPGQIPNPGTYQGSQQLQRQSDAQDQAFRQQQQQSAPQYGGMNYGGARNSTGNFGRASNSRASNSLNAHDQCFLMLTRAPALASLRGLVELGADTMDPRYFTIRRRPTASEKAALMRWVSGRERCAMLQWFPDPVLQQADAKTARTTDDLIAALAQGRMTYGDFNYRRAQNVEAFNRFRASR